MATLSCSCPDAMMSCETGDNGALLLLLFFMAAYGLYRSCTECDDGSDDEAPEGMFS